MSENVVTVNEETKVTNLSNVTRKTRTSFTLAPELLEYVRDKAIRNGVSVSSVIEDAIQAAKGV